MQEVRHRFLFYITLSYSFSIIRPIEAELKKRGHIVAWFVREGAEAETYIRQSDKVLKTISEVNQFNADALLAPGNSIPSFFPGIKVQVFHGFDSGKKNKFKIRDYFDLYCTQGPRTTKGFEEQRTMLNKPTFDVVETGWSKLDPLFVRQAKTDSFITEAKQILYAPTFSPKLTSTYQLLDQIKRLSEEKDWQWRVKFHPKVTREEVDMYKAIECDTLKVIECDSVVPLLQSADVLLSDTSSVLSEFSLLDKAVVCFNNRRPESWMININDASKLESSLQYALEPDTYLLEAIRMHGSEVHPFHDGLSSQRIVDAVEYMIEKGTAHLQKKPINLFRNIKMRIKLGFFS